MTMNRSRIWVVAILLGLCASGAVAQKLGSAGNNFIDAVRDNDGAKALELLNADGSTVVNYRNPAGDSALHLVIARRDGTWTRYLLQEGADANLAGRGGDTPLIAAARVGFVEGVQVLLKRTARIDLGNRQGETALIVAVQQRHPQVVRLLLEAGANPDKTDSAAGYSARDYAKRDRRATELLKLIETVKAKSAAKIAGPKIK